MRPGDKLDRAIRHLGYAIIAFGIAAGFFAGAVIFYLIRRG
jgi:hypothetical protein